jgi:hypothetical protein
MWKVVSRDHFDLSLGCSSAAITYAVEAVSHRDRMYFFLRWIAFEEGMQSSLRDVEAEIAPVARAQTLEIL